MLPIARWIGYGGETNFHGSVLETMTWAAGSAGAHPQYHCVSQPSIPRPTIPSSWPNSLRTIGQISSGRIGLNIVAGWNKPEYEGRSA